MEFAAERFGTSLVVVLGHSMCGAVMATIDEMESPAEESSHNVMSIVNRIRPTVEPLFETELRSDLDRLLEFAIHANILAATNHLRHGSQLLERGDVTILGAEYSLETGIVTFFDS